MKTKDIVYILLAVAILLVAGYIAFTQLVPKTASAKKVQVEVVGSISPDFDQAALTQLSDGTKIRDFSVPLDLSSGLGNKDIFGQ